MAIPREVLAEPGPAATMGIWSLDDPAWSDFVQNHPDATMFHHPRWAQVLSATYGYRSCVLVQTDAAGEIVAGMPIAVMRSQLAGSSLVSLPFTDYCPPLARDAQSLSHFVCGLVPWVQTLGSPRLEIRAETPPTAGVHQVREGYRHVLRLDGGRDAVLRQLAGTPAARAIGKAKRSGVVAHLTQSPRDLPTFYRLHWDTRRRLGVPVQPRHFVEALWAQVIERDLGFLVVATKDDHPIAAAVFLAWNRRLIYKYGASDSHYWELRPNNLVMWTAMEWACARGYQLLDFGKTELDNQGLRDFKSRWGSTEIPLSYSYVSLKPPHQSSRLPMKVVSQVIRRSPPIVCRALGELFYGRFGWRALGDLFYGRFGSRGEACVKTRPLLAGSGKS